MASLVREEQDSEGIGHLALQFLKELVSVRLKSEYVEGPAYPGGLERENPNSRVA